MRIHIESGWKLDFGALLMRDAAAVEVTSVRQGVWIKWQRRQNNKECRAGIIDKRFCCSFIQIGLTWPRGPKYTWEQLSISRSRTLCGSTSNLIALFSPLQSLQLGQGDQGGMPLSPHNETTIKAVAFRRTRQNFRIQTFGSWPDRNLKRLSPPRRWPKRRDLSAACLNFQSALLSAWQLKIASKKFKSPALTEKNYFSFPWLLRVCSLVYTNLSISPSV